jgi:hypothetical protein
MVERKTLATAAATAAVGAATGALVSQALAKPSPAIYIMDEKTLGAMIEKAAEKFLAKIGRTRISMTFPEIVQALTEQGYVTVGSFARSAYLQPGQKVIFEERVPPGRVFVLSAAKIDTSPNHANAVALYFDSSRPQMTDDSMISSRYSDMIYYWQMGMFLKCEKFMRVEVQNISNTQSFYSYLIVYGWVEAHVWKKLVEHFFRVFRMEVLGK